MESFLGSNLSPGIFTLKPFLIVSEAGGYQR